MTNSKPQSLKGYDAEALGKHRMTNLSVRLCVSYTMLTKLMAK